MVAFIITALVGAICIWIGVSNMRGNINSIHSYHRHRVSEEDKPRFGKLCGLGTVVIGIGIIMLGAFSAAGVYTENELYMWLGTVICAIGLILGLGLSFYAMIKYNG